ncbi:MULTISPECIES: DUF5992 family protein [Vibrio]|uniref:DUF5992 family protein n=1 Tax=Vibrio TaxID=662 RepID=UPI000681D6B2|nr:MULTISPECIES: DUF5992 family protein [Vibrio]MCG9680933.1 DUF5992 family protein [Vibrio sp. Isolate24]MCM5511672.1 hypothetical protein [Vibrio sp. SCSIO 43169]MDE3896023.1 hypothetical protein [Vibrio sp. CC007]
MNFGKLILATAIISISSLGVAGQLVKDVQLLEVASNATNGGKSFAVLIDGGNGVCAGTPTAKQWIYFPEAKFNSIASYNQSFSLALTALTTGKSVRIHNYADNSCTGADFISISK